METKYKVVLTIFMIGILNMVSVVTADNDINGVPTDDVFDTRGTGKINPGPTPEPEPEDEPVVHVSSGGSSRKICNLDRYDRCNFGDGISIVFVKFDGEIYKVTKQGPSILGDMIVKVEGENEYVQHHPVALFRDGVWHTASLKGLMEYLIWGELY